MADKAARAGIPILAAVSAPTGLAIDRAEAIGLTLIAFARQDRFSIYAHPERITP
jgi:formate dehydrogenase accessory protein FdhD